MTTIELNQITNKTKINEKLMQESVLRYLENKLNTKIDSEEQKTISYLQEHTYLILQDLKLAIKNLNRNTLNDYKDVIDENELITHILNDFIEKFDLCKTNVEIYELIHISEKKLCPLNALGVNKSIYYQVLDLEDLKSNSNKLRIVREKRIKDSFFKEEELPDFAIYVNGLPFFVIELKTLERSYKAAIKDYKNKKSYKHFLGCICSDIENSIIVAGQHNKEYLWLNYGKHMKDNSNSLIDIIDELILQKENMLFYFLYSCKIKGSEKKSIQNARIQQYFVSKQYFEIFKKLKIKSENNQSIKEKSYFKHHTRTGKTFSINLILNILSNKYENLYTKIFILAHDLTVLNNFEKEFKGESFGVYGNVKLIGSKEEYINVINSFKYNKNKEIYLLNIQKMDLPKKTTNENNEVVLSVDNIYKNEDVLFIIDEVHTHQNLEDGYAYVRNAKFPEASYITTTATPEMKEITKGKFKNETSIYFGLEVDNFTPNDAVRLKIVTKVKYEKFLWTTRIDKEDEYNNLMKQVAELDRLTKEKVLESILEADDKLEKLCLDMANLIYGHNNFFKTNRDNIHKYLVELFIDNYDYNNKFLNNEEYYLELYGKENVDYMIKLYRSKVENSTRTNYESIKTTLEKDLKNALITEKIDIIANDMTFLQKKAKYDFRPKAFWVVSSVNEGLNIIEKLKQKITNEEDRKQNIYKNHRFALDVSKFDYTDYELDREDQETLENNVDKLKDINGKYVKESSNLKKKSHTLVDFETENDESIDVLIIVGKYLMGYDLDRLVKVYIDTNINDYKRIIQIATRGSTIREGKEISFVLDLNLNRDTQTLFSEALKLYNGDDEYQEFMLDDDVVKEKLDLLNIELNKVANFFFEQNELLIKENILDYNGLSKYPKNKDILINNQLISTFLRILTEISQYISEDIENKNENIDYDSYWKSIKIINQILKDLTIPEYFIKEDENYLLYIESLMKINAIYFKNILYKESLGLEPLNEYEIRMIIRDTFKILSKDFDEELHKNEIKNINDILKIGNEKNLITEELENDTNAFVSSLISLQTTLAKQNESGTILDKIDKLIKSCSSNNKLLNKELENDLYKELKDLEEKQVIFIKEKCNSNLNLYIVYLELKEKLKSLNLIINESLIIKFSNIINSNLTTILNNNNYNKVINKQDWIENETKQNELTSKLFGKIADYDKVFSKFSIEEQKELNDFYNYLIIDIDSEKDKEFEKRFLNKILIKIFDVKRIYSSEVFNDFYSK